MKLINAKQGSSEWLEERSKPNTFNASEANALMGVSKYLTRTELLRQKKTGITHSVSDTQQRLFNRGHEAENTARVIAENIIGQEFYPTVGYIEVEDMRLLASFDGITFDESVLFEHKLWNEPLADSVKNGVIPDSHLWQLEQQLLVSGAEKVLFMVSDGTEQNCAWCYYESQPEAGATLIAAWKQFKADLETFEPEPEVIKAKPTLVDDLLLPSIVVTGQIAVESNLDLFGEVLHDFISRINIKPETDEDFVNISKAIKSLEKAEEWLDKQEEGVISKFDQLNQTIALKNTLKELARENRLMLKKIDKAEKENRKAQIVFSAKSELNDHANRLQAELPVTFGFNQPNFADAIKGKKTISSTQDAVSTMLANAKIEADALARDLREKHTWYIENAGEYSFLFSDLQTLIYKDFDSFKAVAQNRVLTHKEQEKAKAEAAAKAQAEREEKIRKEAEEKARREEQERIKAEAEAKAKAIAEVAQAMADAEEQAYREKLERENQAELEHAAQKANEKRSMDTVDTGEQSSCDAVPTVQAVDVQPVEEPNQPIHVDALVSGNEAPETFRGKAINIIATHWEIDYYEAEQWLINEFSNITETEQ